MEANNYNCRFTSERLKLIVVMGFQDSGKTTCLKGRSTPLPQLNGLCKRLSGGTDAPVGGNEHCREAICSINGKTVSVYFGLDGDSEDIVYQNIENIGNKSPNPYDVAIITLQRRAVGASLSVGTVWQKWIDKSIHKYLRRYQSFPAHERYYVHTVIPQVCDASNNYTGKIGTNVVIPPNWMWDALTTCLQDHIVALLSIIV